MAAAPRDGAIGVRGCFPLAVRSVSMSEHEQHPRDIDALMREALDLNALGRREEAIAVYGDVVARFGGKGDPALAWDLASALLNRALALQASGRREEAVADLDELVARFGATTDPEVGGIVAAALRTRAQVLTQLGRVDEALVAYDAAVAVHDRFVEDCGEARSSRLRVSAAYALLGKIWLLSRLGRREEMVSAYDALFARVGPTPEPALRGDLLSALLAQSGLLCRLGLDEKAATLPAMVVALFGAGTGSAPEPDPAPGDGDADAAVAALLAATYRSDCWDWFAAPAEDRPRALLAGRAVDIYRATAPVLAGDDDWDSPRIAAALHLRSIADGYALLARAGSLADNVSAKLPNRALAELGVRTAGLDHWAEDLDHPLDLGEPDTLDEVPERAEQSDDAGERFPLAFLQSMRAYEIIAAARESPPGGEILCSERFQSRSVDCIVDAQRWTAWLLQWRPEAKAGAIAMLVFSQAYFVAAWTTAPREEWFPSIDFLREVLAESDALEWLAQEGALPDWLSERG
jgi:tetratricopeptide (TPR) repeat protein